MELSRRVQTLAPSPTVAMMNRAKGLRAQGVDVLSFSAGEPDFDTPERIKQAAVAALLRGETKYMPTAGDPETRKVIAAKLTNENGIPGVTADHVVISSGGKHALFSLFHCLFDPPTPAPGSENQQPMEAVLPTPTWVSYTPHVELAGGKVVEVPAGPEAGFRITPEQLRTAITPRSRCLVLNSPSNPCGTMYTPAELKALAEVVAEAARTVAPNLVVISDEIYEKIVYGGIEHFSIGSVPEIAERTVTVNGLSKAFAMTGWRVGYVAGSGEFGLKLAKGLSTLQGQMSTNITSFVYPAIRTALTECADDVERMRQAFARRAELIYGIVSKMPGVKVAKPTGAFYVFPDVSAYFGKRSAGGRAVKDAKSFCEALLDEGKVALVAGDEFGGCGPRCVRISVRVLGGADRDGDGAAGGVSGGDAVREGGGYSPPHAFRRPPACHR